MNIWLKIAVATLGLSAAGLVAMTAARMPFPSDAAMRDRFLAHRADFEQLVAMANENDHLVRIAPDFTWLDDDSAWPRKNIGISAERWGDYRRLFQSTGASGGFVRFANPTLIKFFVVSRGLVPSGAVKGLAYSQAELTPVLKSLNERPPDKFRNGPDRSHILVYKPIDNHWYIYYEEW